MTDIIQLIKEAFANIWTSKLRSSLTLLGVLIGTASVVALVSSGQLATQHALAQFKTLGTDLLSVSINSTAETSPNQAQKLTLNDMFKIEKASPNILEIAPYTNYYGGVSYLGQSLDGGIIGATDGLQDIVKIKLAQGRFVSTLDSYLNYCVIGNGIANKMKSAGTLDPIGKQIRVGYKMFTVVGVAKPWAQNMFMYADVDNALIIPIESSFDLSKYAQIQNIIFKLKPNSDIDKTQNQITDTINQILPKQQLYFRSAKQIIESMAKQRQTLTLLLALIGGISLIVGGIGVMNIMLVSVTERRKEIGIRMAVGATGKDIGWMFVTEAIVLTLVGGLLGILCGIIVSFIAAKLSGWEFQVFLLPPLVGFLVSALVGVISGFYPAYKASQLDPIQTLRSE